MFTDNLKGTKAAIKQSGHAKKKATSSYLAPKEKYFLLNIYKTHLVSVSLSSKRENAARRKNKRREIFQTK